MSATGRFFLEEARAVLRRAEEAARQVKRFDLGESGRLNVGLTSSASLHPIAQAILRTFHDAYPHAEVSVQESETYELILALQDGSIDVALFHITPDRFPDLDHIPLAEVELLVAAPNAHPLASATEPVTLDRLLNEDFVIYRRREGPGIFNHIQQVFEEAGASIRIAGDVTRLIAAINLVASGRGITLVPATMCMLHPESVTYLPLAADTFSPLPLSLAYRRDERIALVRNFLALTKGATDGL